MANYSGYQPNNYISGYVSPNFEVIQQHLANMQNREDKVMELYSAQMARLNEEKAYDTATRQKLMDNFRQGFDELYTQAGGNMANIAPQAFQYINNAKADPAWNLLDIHNKAMEQEIALRKQLQAQGISVLNFKPTPVSIIDDNGYYRDPADFEYDVQGMRDYPKAMDEEWATALKPEGEFGKESFGGMQTQLGLIPGFWNRTGGGGISERQISGSSGTPGFNDVLKRSGGKFGLVWNRYKATDDYKQHLRKLTELDGMTNEAAEETIGQMFLDTGRKRLIEGNYRESFTPYNPSDGGNSGGGSSTGDVNVDVKFNETLENFIAGIKNGSSLQKIGIGDPSHPALGFKRGIERAIIADPVVKHFATKINGYVGPILSTLKQANLYTPGKYPLLESGNMHRNPSEFRSQLKSLEQDVIEEVNKQHDLANLLIHYVTTGTSYGDMNIIPALLEARKQMSMFDISYDKAFQKIKAEGLSTAAKAYGYNTAADTPKSVTATSTMQKGINDELTSQIKNYPEYFEVVDDSKNRTLQDIKFDDTTIEFGSAFATPETGIIFNITYKPDIDGQTAKKSVQVKVRVKEDNARNGIIRALDSKLGYKLTAIENDIYRVDVITGGLYNIKNNQDLVVENQILKNKGISITEGTRKTENGTINTYTFNDANANKPITFAQFKSALVNKLGDAGAMQFLIENGLNDKALSNDLPLQLDMSTSLPKVIDILNSL